MACWIDLLLHSQLCNFTAFLWCPISSQPSAANDSAIRVVLQLTAKRIYHTGARWAETSHQKHQHRVAWLDTPKRLLDVSRKWFLKINLQLCILTCHWGEAASLLSVRVMKHCPVKYKYSVCFLVPQHCFHAEEAHSLETSGNISCSVGVPEAPTLLNLFVFLIKLDTVLFFLMLGWCCFLSFAV